MFRNFVLLSCMAIIGCSTGLTAESGSKAKAFQAATVQSQRGEWKFTPMTPKDRFIPKARYYAVREIKTSRGKFVLTRNASRSDRGQKPQVKGTDYSFLTPKGKKVTRSWLSARGLESPHFVDIVERDGRIFLVTQVGVAEYGKDKYGREEFVPVYGVKGGLQLVTIAPGYYAVTEHYRKRFLGVVDYNAATKSWGGIAYDGKREVFFPIRSSKSGAEMKVTGYDSSTEESISVVYDASSAFLRQPVVSAGRLAAK